MTGTSQEPGPSSAAPPRAPRWMTVSLIASLAVNLLIAGIVIGAVASGGPGGERLGGREFGRSPFLQALEPQDRRALARELREDGEGLLRNRRELRGKFEEILALLRADSFDRTALERLIDEQRSVAVGRQMIGERAILDRLESMSPSQRRAYADRLDQSVRRDR